MAITKRNNYMIFVLLTYLAALICRIFLYHFTGGIGMAYFAIANEIFLAIGGMCFYSIQEATASLMKYRVRREQYKSAAKVFHGALLWGLVAGVVLAALMGILGETIASYVYHVPHATLAIWGMVAAIPFEIEIGVLRGFFLGNNMRAPLVHSGILFVVAFGAAGCIGSYRLLLYGQNVSALLRSDTFQYVYGAMGASVGLTIATILCFLYLFVLYLLFQSSLKKEMGREYQKTQDTRLHIFQMLLGTGGFYALSYFVFFSVKFLDQILFFVIGADGENRVSDYGNYYAKCDSLSRIVLLLIICLFYPFLRKVLYFVEREEYRIARERLGILLHKCVAVTCFCMTLLAVFAENLLDILFAASHNTAMAGWLQVNALAAVFLVFSFLFLCFLVRMKKGRMVLMVGGCSLLVHLAVMGILISSTGLGVMAIAISNLVGSIVLAVMSFLMVSRSIQYHQEWIRNVAIPAVSAAAAGLLAMLLNRVLSGIMGELFSMLLGMVLALMVYLTLLLVTRNFGEEELNNSFLGRGLIFLGKTFHLF